MNLYSDNDRYCAEWLCNLIGAGEIPNGDVDERSIADVKGTDLAEYTQVHLFAGIAGWSYALRLAQWPNDVPVWTGSCPCQPFSVAGKRKGESDRRHLWPEMRRLIDECRPPVVFGEQVASAAGRDWLAGVRSDLEALGYAVGAADLCVAGIAAPHIRQRLYWVAYSHSRRFEQCDKGVRSIPIANASSGLDNPAITRQPSTGTGQQKESQRRQCLSRVGRETGWATGVFVNCADGKSRRIEPGICPLAHGVRGRVGKLRAYGNAIVPQLAAVFIRESILTVNLLAGRTMGMGI